MSVTTLTLIICDSCGDTYGGGDNKQLSAKEQREDFNLDEWVYKNGKDYCDKCAGGTE